MDLHGSFHVYDTTLRDGAQQEGLNLSVQDGSSPRPGSRMLVDWVRVWRPGS